MAVSAYLVWVSGVNQLYAPPMLGTIFWSRPRGDRILWRVSSPPRLKLMGEGCAFCFVHGNSYGHIWRSGAQKKYKT